MTTCSAGRSGYGTAGSRSHDWLAAVIGANGGLDDAGRGGAANFLPVLFQATAYWIRCVMTVLVLALKLTLPL